jgi:hypothetical protein
MPIVLNKELYAEAKRDADRIYSKPSAYKSGYIVKKYKSLGGRYGNDNKEHNLGRWFYKEHWKDVGHKGYPVYRPTVRANSKTPLTVNEIDKKNLQEQINRKQIIKGSQNLPPFKKSMS